MKTIKSSFLWMLSITMFISCQKESITDDSVESETLSNAEWQSFLERNAFTDVDVVKLNSKTYKLSSLKNKYFINQIEEQIVDDMVYEMIGEGVLLLSDPEKSEDNLNKRVNNNTAKITFRSGGKRRTLVLRKNGKAKLMPRHVRHAWFFKAKPGTFRTFDTSDRTRNTSLGKCKQALNSVVRYISPNNGPTYFQYSSKCKP